MAKIGLKKFKYSKLDENGVPTAPATLGKAVSCQVSVTNNSAELYADDTLAESDYSFSRAQVTLGVDDEADATFADLLGHTITDGEVVCNNEDTAPYVAIGRIVTKIVGGLRKYKVEFLSKVKFQEPNQEDQTKGETVEFTTSQIVGIASALPSGEWRKFKTFDDEDDAIEYLDELLTAPTTNPPAEEPPAEETTETNTTTNP